VWIVGVVIGLVALIGVIAILHTLQLEKRVQTLPATLQSAATAAENGQLRTAQVDLLQAQDTLTSVNSTLYNSPDFAIVGLLPVARQNIDAVRDAVKLGLQMIGGGEQILQAALPLESHDGHLEVPLNQGQIPLSTSESVATALSDVATNLPTSATTSGGGLVLSRVRSLQEKVYAQAVRRRNELGSVGASMRLLDDIAGANGNRRYLIAVANSAEMRGSGGMILSYGVLTSHAGKVSLAHFGPIDELKLTQPETKVPFPSDFTSRYSDLGPTLNWRNVNLMSDFTVDAPVMEAMYTQATGLPVDGVIQVDPAGLGAILAGVGPVQTPDLGLVSAANVVPLTLSDAYQVTTNRQLRQDYTGEVAQAAFAQLTSGRFPGLRPLGTALVAAGKDRHVMMYTNDGTDEAIIRGLAFDGALPAPTTAFTQLTVQNLGGDKLDYYLRSALTLTGSRPSALGGRLTATIDLANTAPPGRTSPVEVFGPYNPGGTAGAYQGLVTLYLPAHSQLMGSETASGVTTSPVQDSQNGVTTVTFTVTIPAGTGTHVVLNLYVAPTSPSASRFVMVPTPRVISTVYRQKLS
jgi:hypothetical protein